MKNWLKSLLRRLILWAEVPLPPAEQPPVWLMPRTRKIAPKFLKVAGGQFGQFINVAEVVKVIPVNAKGITEHRYAFAKLSSGEEVEINQAEFDSIVGGV